MTTDILKLLFCDFKLTTAEIARILMIPESAVAKIGQSTMAQGCPGN